MPQVDLKLCDDCQMLHVAELKRAIGLPIMQYTLFITEYNSQYQVKLR